MPRSESALAAEYVFVGLGITFAVSAVCFLSIWWFFDLSLFFPSGFLAASFSLLCWIFDVISAVWRTYLQALTRSGAGRIAQPERRHRKEKTSGSAVILVSSGVIHFAVVWSEMSI